MHVKLIPMRAQLSKPYTLSPKSQSGHRQMESMSRALIESDRAVGMPLGSKPEGTRTGPGFGMQKLGRTELRV